MQKIIVPKNVISVILIILSVILMSVAFFKVLTISDTLILDYKVLKISDYNTSSTAFNELIFWGGTAFFFCLIAFFHLLKSGKTETIYVEKKEDKSSVIQSKQNVSENTNNTLINQLDLLIGDIKKQHITHKEVLSKTANILEAMQGILYLKQKSSYVLSEGYAIIDLEDKQKKFSKSDGLVGRVVSEMQPLILNNVEKQLRTVSSGLGKGSPTNMIIFPLIKDNKVTGVFEYSLFKPLDKEIIEKLKDLAASWALLEEKNNDEKVKGSNKKVEK